MDTFINYLFEVNLGILVFYGLYLLLLKSESNFRFNRLYLVGALIVSLTFPLLSFETSQEISPSIRSISAVHWLPALNIGESNVVQPSESNRSHYSLPAVMLIIYAAVAGVLLSRFLLEMIRIARLIMRRNSDAIIEVEGDTAAFSFIKWVFMGNRVQLSDEEMVSIIKHEHAHIALKHSVDVVIIRIVRVLCWFNPALIWYNRDLCEVHEFEADERSVKEDDVDKYCDLLARVTLTGVGYQVASHFNSSLTIKRIKMLTTVKNKLRIWKILAILPVVLIFFFAVACQDQVIEDLRDASETSSVALHYPIKVQQQLSELHAANPDVEYMVMRVDATNKAKLKKIDDQFAKVVYFAVIDGNNDEEKEAYVILEKNSSTNQLADMTKSGDEVFVIVEETATPQIGLEEYYKVLVQDMKYPRQARLEGIEGRVFVQFVVNTDGTISDVQALKGIGGGCDEEAVRVVKEADVVWNPARQRGKEVRQKMVLPITFSTNFKPAEEKATGMVNPNQDEMKIEYQVLSNEKGKAIVGKVLTEKGEPLPGVNIVVDGKTYGTVSDRDGSFKLKLQETTGNVSVSHVSYKTAKIKF